MKDLWNSVFEPMLLDEIEKPFNKDNYLFEPKYDGIRALIFVSQSSIKIINRHKKDITNLFPELKCIQNLVKKKIIFDGEIVCTEEGLPSFSKIQERIHLKNLNKIQKTSIDNPATFICFDILYENKNLINLNLMERKRILNTIKDNDFFIKTKYIKSEGIKLFKIIKKIPLEGIVAKEINSPYEINTRSSSWIKIKNYKQETFYIGAYSEKDNTYVFSVALGEFINNEFIFVGRICIPKKEPLYNNIKEEQLTKNQFNNYSDNNMKYVKPKYKCYVRYIERTKNNNLRQPIFGGERSE